MVKRIVLLGLMAVFMFSLSGCATTRKNDELLTQGLKNKIMALEAQINEKDNEINSLKESMSKSSEESALSTDKAGAFNQADGKQIQTALKNAGYYDGLIDGKMGKKTRRAIRGFQKANNLNADGKVGKQTWAVLSGYLEKKVK
jgi:peptidoglycan hydrolase-like protein with peptidoglycan-binding domain